MAKRGVVRRGGGKSGGARINVEKMNDVIKRVHLGGAIGDCVLEVYKDGRVGAKAIDLTNSIFLFCYIKGVISGMRKRVDVGIGNLQLLQKYFQSIDDGAISFEISSEENRIIFKREKKKSHFDFLLKDSDLISTKFDAEDKNYLEKLMGGVVYSVGLTETQRDLFVSLCNTLSMAETKQVRVHTEGGCVKLVGGIETGHMFEIELGKPKQKVKKEVDLIYYADHLHKVLGAIDFDEGVDVKLHFGPDSPLVVLIDNQNFWALSEVSE